MKLVYINSKKRFMDLEAIRPRYMKLEAAAQYADLKGYDGMEMVRNALRNPQELPPKPKKQPAELTALQIIKSHEIKYYDVNRFRVRSMTVTRNQLTEYLLGCGYGLRLTLKTLILALDRR